MLTNIHFQGGKATIIINPHGDRPLNQTEHFTVKSNMQKNTPYDV